MSIYLVAEIFAPGRILELHKLNNKDIYKITILTEIPSRTKTSSEKAIQVVEHYILPANEIEQQIISNWRNIKLTTHLKYTLSQNGFDFELIGIKFNKIGIPNKKALEILAVDNLMNYFKNIEGSEFLIKTSIDEAVNNKNILEFYEIQSGILSVLNKIKNKDFFDEEFCTDLFNDLQCLNFNISKFEKQFESSSNIKETLINQLREILSIQLGIFKLKDQIKQNSKE